MNIYANLNLQFHLLPRCLEAATLDFRVCELSFLRWLYCAQCTGHNIDNSSEQRLENEHKTWCNYNTYGWVIQSINTWIGKAS
jgi:hypothetical protein